MLAFHGKPELKEFYVNRAIQHRKADEIVQGYDYWKNGKGCAIGCLAHANTEAHLKLQNDAGLPRTVNRLADGIFEGLSKDLAVQWPQRYMEACAVGADLSQVADRFLHWLMVDPADGIIKFAKSDKSRAAIQRVIDLCTRKIAGEKISHGDWRDAAAAAADADADAHQKAQVRQADKLIEFIKAAPVASVAK